MSRSSATYETSSIITIMTPGSVSPSTRLDLLDTANTRISQEAPCLLSEATSLGGNRAAIQFSALRLSLVHKHTIWAFLLYLSFSHLPSMREVKQHIRSKGVWEQDGNTTKFPLESWPFVPGENHMRAKLLQSCPTLWDPPRTVAHQAPLSMGYSRQEYWSRLPFPSRGDLPHRGIEPTSLMSPALAGRLFITSATWEAPERIKKGVSGVFHWSAISMKSVHHSENVSRRADGT